ncbi:UNVERIFIED_CONTAM: Retrovirus-related Pol polyprotein from transposon RE2 [Sesamum latifolium]|uniref:Retrovirus-related Pol polyprotein from transposon RE2 n=1 Tax=Sesamum latifolium TaxID=2727402 RepID=A0AAW2U525_9LAMI
MLSLRLFPRTVRLSHFKWYQSPVRYEAMAISKGPCGKARGPQVWTLVDPPKGVRLVGCKWVYKRKFGAEGEVTAFKDRLVAKGFTQRPGVDFEETYLPVAMAKSIRILLAIATWYEYEIWQMDMKMTFLNGFVEEEIFLDHSEGFTVVGESVVSKGPSTASSKLPEARTHVVMKSYGVIISSKTTMILVYTRRSVGARLRTLCFMSMMSCSLGMMLRC